MPENGSFSTCSFANCCYLMWFVDYVNSRQLLIIVMIIPSFYDCIDNLGFGCQRFHGLSEFDEKKKSCRRRLSDHNARRRKQPGSVHLNSRVSSSLYGTGLKLRL
jgi:hypothetical protein